MPAARRRRVVRRSLGRDLALLALWVVLLGASAFVLVIVAGFMARWAWALLEYGWRLHG